MNDTGHRPPPPPPAWEPHYSEPPGTEPSLAQRLKKLFAPIGVALLVALKFAAKLKYVAIPLVKFFPILLKTGGTMLLSIGAYAMMWGWMFALGFVLLLFVHECGHLLVARFFGLRVGAPVFIPFMGALIALKEAPKDAWMEAWVGIGGPLLGSAGALVCEGLYQLTGNPLFRGLAFSGFFLNLFNLAPIGYLDGGRIVTALSPWLWLAGAAVMVGLLVLHPNFIVGLILILSLPRLWFLFRKKSDEERRYFEVSPGRRLAMAGLYFGLIAVLVMGMKLTHLVPASQAERPVQSRWNTSGSSRVAGVLSGRVSISGAIESHQRRTTGKAGNWAAVLASESFWTANSVRVSRSRKME